MTTITDSAVLEWERQREVVSGLGEERLARLRARLVRAVARVCPPWLANDREDIVQTALVKLMGSAKRGCEDLEHSAAYLRRVAYTHVVDEIRRRRRRSESPLEVVEGASPTLASPRPDPEASSVGSELGAAIRQCLAGMVAPRRDAVSLWLLGYSHREIAHRMGWNAKRAENLVTRGRANLRDCLQSKGFKG